MKKRLFSTLLVLCMVLALLPITAFAAGSGTCGSNATWTLDNNGKLTISGTGVAERPDNYYEDWNHLVKTVEVGEGITELGTAIFELGASATKVTLPETLTVIGEAAFYLESNLKEINIPSRVSVIGDGAFFACSSLTSITLPSGLTTIGEMAFTGIDVPSVTVPRSVTSIGEWGLGYRMTDNWETEKIPGFTIYGYAGTEAERYAKANSFTFKALSETPAPVVVLSSQKLAVDGKDINCEKYNIDGSNYFKLRDLAQLLSGTGSQFAVGYDAASATVTITTGEGYVSTGTELVTGADNSKTAQPSNQAILINGVRHSELTVYNIGGSNFFQLRELGNLLNFEVGYDTATNTATVRSVG